MKQTVVLIAALVSLTALTTRPVGAADHKVAPLNEPPPKAGLSAELAGQFAATGIRVTRDSANYCDLWLCQSLATVDGFKATSEVLYPFAPGQLIGLVRFTRKGADFRDQAIRPGVYTLRYSQQPVDGAHVGTSPTRDFAVLITVANDSSAGALEYKELTKQSAEAAESSHPAIFCLQAVPSETSEFPSIRHEEQHDWWIIAVRGEVKKNGQASPLPIGLVVAGLAPEL